MKSANDDWIARARALTPVLDKAAPRIEAACALPPDVLDALHEAKLFRMLLPRSLGGAELELAAFFQVIGAIAEGDASTAWSRDAERRLRDVGRLPRAGRGARDLRRRARGAGLGISRRRVPRGAGRRAAGRSTAPGDSAAATATPRGWAATASCRTGGERTMLFPRSAVAIKPDSWNVVGLRGTGSDTYSVTDLFVPARASP